MLLFTTPSTSAGSRLRQTRRSALFTCIFLLLLSLVLVAEGAEAEKKPGTSQGGKGTASANQPPKEQQSPKKAEDKSLPKSKEKAGNSKAAFSASDHVVKSGGDAPKSAAVGVGVPAKPAENLKKSKEAEEKKPPAVAAPPPEAQVDGKEKAAPAQPPKSPSLVDGDGRKEEETAESRQSVERPGSDQVPPPRTLSRADRVGTGGSQLPTHHVMASLVGLSILLAGLYVAWHNRKKIMGLLIEGRRGAGGRRTTAGTNVRYRRLSQNEGESEQRNYIS